jgi:hypothetical protein
MKRRTIVIFFLTHAALLVGGFYLGKFLTFQDAMKKAKLIGSLGATGMFHEYLKAQLEQGSCGEAAEALLSYERMLDQFKGRDGALVLGGLSSFERVTTYVRLAKIARKQKDDGRASEYLSVARKACEEAKWADCSEQSVMNKTEMMDRKIHIKCLVEHG